MHQLILFDERIAATFADWVAGSPLLAKICVVLGVGLVYIIPFLLIYVWFIYSKKLALGAAVAGLIAWEGLSKLIAFFLPRPRPAESQIGVHELVFHRPDTSFPSDHSAFLLAIALWFYLSGQKKLGNLVLIIAIVVGVTRVGIGVHFPGDVLAGWLVGLIVALLLYAIREPLDRYLLEPLVQLARKIHL